MTERALQHEIIPCYRMYLLTSLASPAVKEGVLIDLPSYSGCTAECAPVPHGLLVGVDRDAIVGEVTLSLRCTVPRRLRGQLHRPPTASFSQYNSLSHNSVFSSILQDAMHIVELGLIFVCRFVCKSALDYPNQPLRATRPWCYAWSLSPPAWRLEKG